MLEERQRLEVRLRSVKMDGLITFENDTVIGLPTVDDNGKILERALVGSYVIVPKSGVATPFDLSEHEWLDVKKMIDTLKNYLDEKYKPDGYNLGWNVGSVAGQTWEVVHLHVIPRFKDEPRANIGIRFWLKQDENTRPCN